MMGINRKFLIALGIAILAATGCKKEESVQTPVNNDPEVNTVLLIEPVNNGQVNTYTPVIRWDSFSGANSYTVHVSTDANFITPGILDTSVTETQITIPAGRLQTNIYYYWKVRADQGSGNFTSYSETRRFTVILAPPPPPVLLLPLNNSVDQPFLPFFDWEDSPSAETYRLQVSINSSFIPVLLDSANISGSQLQSPYFYFNTGTNYFWKVNASNSNGLSTGEWSETFSFRTVEGLRPSSISGRVRFAETNFINPPFRYIVGAYEINNWPPVNILSDYADTLVIQQVNNEFIADYIIRNVPNGSYHITVYAQTRSISNDVLHKSVFGCDTARVIYSNCPLSNPGTVTINNGNGIGNINMLSWADSLKTIF
ncbi:MAG TPA: hypothetical protein PKE39_01855 [Ignavibacteria bacterium]|nr:hypothetical protein [Ignavibacteria bacterium]HMQ97744.1 hypothetical protein [Ignavibacteria bacterium]